MIEEDNKVASDCEEQPNGINKNATSKLKTNNIQITKREDLLPLFEASDNTINKIHFSDIPQICKDEPCELGVDEAGRGPVLGPMVYGISYIPLSRKKILVDIGCADSKSLTENKRDEIFDKICNHSDDMGWAIDAISPNVISTSMHSRTKESLNEISMNSAANLIKKAIEAGVNVTRVYVDTVGKPQKYQARLQNIFPDLKIVVESKADATYPIVSAASICAKVSRDHALRIWKFGEPYTEAEYGSGYPNDPVTKEWLKTNVDPVFGFPRLVRFSWSTAKVILEKEAVPVEWEEVEDSDLNTSKDRKILQFFAKTPEKNVYKKHKSRHMFFTERCLSSATTL